MLRVPAGHYKMLLHAEGMLEDGTAAGAYALGEIVVRQGGTPECSVLLHSGATLIGQALTADGEVAAGARLQFSTAPWSEARRTIYGATTDPEGRFELQGLIPGAALFCKNTRETIPIGPADQTSHATVRLRR